jgi:hypothetical protein
MQDFEDYLMTKYPDLFPKDKDGNPRHGDCGVGGNDEWKPVIEALCHSIDSYCKYTSRCIKTKKIWPRIKLWIYNHPFKSIYNLAYSCLDPYLGVIPSSVDRSKPYIVKEEWTNQVKNRKRYLLRQRLQKLYHNLRPTGCYQIVKPNQVIIQQVKNKFGRLRFYTDGGDSNVYGMIFFAESLCDKISQKKIKFETLDV